MPIIKSAKKAARQAKARTEHNAEIKKAIKTAVKNFKKNPDAKKLALAQSELDKAVKKDLIKKNTAARRKAQLHKIAKGAGIKLEKKANSVATKAPAKKATTKPVVAKKPATKSTAKTK